MDKASKQSKNILPEVISDLYEEALSKEEADDAASNLTGFFELLLEIHNEKENAHVAN